VLIGMGMQSRERLAVAGHDKIFSTSCILLATEQAAEEGVHLIELCQKHTSGAKAPLTQLAFFAGDKSPAYRPIEFVVALLKEILVGVCKSH
jgi:hypothetical protein